MVLTEFNHQTAILESKFEGELTVEDLVAHNILMNENESYPSFLKILIDSTKATVKFPSSDLPILAEKHLEIIEKYNYIVTAIILDSPKETAFAILFQKLTENKKFEFQLFASREAALKWLNSY